MVRMFDRAGRAGDTVGSASRGARNTDHILASTRDTLVSADNADTRYPSMDYSSRRQKPVPLRCGNLR
jgi:hypothetical protein